MTSKLNKATKTSTRGKLVAKARQPDASVSANAETVRRCTIPLNKLVPDPQNVRRFNSEAGIDQLCAMIATNGLLQNLDVRPAPKGKYFVTAGARRLRALKELGKRGTVIETEGVKVTGAYPVAVMILSAKHRPTEVSLVENLGRTNMPVADEVEAFRKLTEEDGFSPEQIADRFGISHTTVRRRVKLAKVSGKIMEEFRAGHVTLDQMEALAVADDHGEQEAAFYGLPEWNRDARQIRAQLTAEKIRGDNRLVRFVGLDAYTQAGGSVTRDLFSEGTDLYLDSKPIVMKLVFEKLAAAAQGVEAEGWKWTEYFASERECGQHLPTIPSFKREHTQAENAEVAGIMAFVEANEPAYDAGELSENDQEAYEAKIARMDEIDAACIGFDPELVAYAGARLFLNHDGEIVVRRGLLKKEEQHELAARERARADEQREADALSRGEAFVPEPPTLSSETQESEEGAVLSAAVIEDLTKYRTVALACELAERPDVALATLVHAMALPLVYGNGRGYGLTPAVAIRPTPAPINVSTADEDNLSAFKAFEEIGAHWLAILPENAGQLWTWCFAAEPEQLQRLLAYLVASTANAVAFRHEAASFGANRLAHAEKLAEAVNLDMGKWWRPGREFFKRVPKSIAAQAVTEAGCDLRTSVAILKGTKAEAVDIAERALEGSGWLPAPLRSRPTPQAAQEGEDGTGEAPDVTEDAGENDPAGEFADDGHDEAGALASVYGPDEE